MRIWAGLAVGCLIIFLMLRWFEHSQVFHPSRALAVQADALGVPFEDLTLKSDGLALHAWYFPAPSNSARANMVVLVCHGNGGN
ncbi:MAG TPA: hypothetical protein VN673_10760, partial [Clostridia bacterium]|nr:hypothetical protein [Clostridia bacterium]